MKRFGYVLWVGLFAVLGCGEPEEGQAVVRGAGGPADRAGQTAPADTLDAGTDADGGRDAVADDGGGGGQDAGRDSGKAVSLSMQVQPLFDVACKRCHSGMAAEDLDLSTAENSFSGLVGVMSEECTREPLVKPGAPDQSYLMWKLAGVGPNGVCYQGREMPLRAPALPPEEVALIRAWIAQGAQDN